MDINLAVKGAVFDLNCPVLISVFINAAVDPERAWTASFTDILSNLLGVMSWTSLVVSPS
jgi:hypothetical protein